MVASQVKRGAREFWQFYRRYTATAIHTAATASLAIFGLLIFVDPLFALVAIASYVLPPVVLYAIGWSPSSDRETEGITDPGDRRSRSELDDVSGHSRPAPDRFRGSNDRDTDTNSDDGDFDTDSDDGDTDTDTGT